MLHIKYPYKESEFEIQAAIFNRLKELGYDVRGEVTDIQPEREKGFRQSRFDLVVFENKKAKFIIEVKNYKKTNFNTRQDLKYLQYEAELIYCSSINGIEDLIKYISVDNSSSK